MEITASAATSLEDLRLRAQRSLQAGRGVLRNASAELLDMKQTVGEAGLNVGDSVTLQVRQTAIASTQEAFAAILGDGSVVTWPGCPLVVLWDCSFLVSIVSIELTVTDNYIQIKEISVFILRSRIAVLIGSEVSRGDMGRSWWRQQLGPGAAQKRAPGPGYEVGLCGHPGGWICGDVGGWRKRGCLTFLW